MDRPKGIFNVGYRYSEDGYALPSVLLLITILALLASSLLSFLFLHTELVHRRVEQTATEYAAQNGITSALASSFNTPADDLFAATTHNTTIAFDDGSRSTVSLIPWGAFMLIHSTGATKHATSERFALAGALPGSRFDNAVILANTEHQLVFAGSSQIKGNVIVGPYGATVGSIPGAPTPHSLPVTGSVTKTSTAAASLFDERFLQRNVAMMKALFTKKRREDISDSQTWIVNGGEKGVYAIPSIPDSIEYVFIVGNAVLDNTITRRGPPLYLIVRGSLLLRDHCSLQGSIALLSTEAIQIPASAQFIDAILFSFTSIDVASTAHLSAQIISPRITLHSGAVASYPSVLISLHLDTASHAAQQIVMEKGSRVEGTVMMLQENADDNMPDCLQLMPRATVVGLVYSQGKTTLDGTVIGSVVTRSFYFYEAPTTYIDWLRSGLVDRTALPKSFLLPLGFDSQRYQVIDWL